MQLVKATTKKVYSLDKSPICRLMSQGIKLSQEVFEKMEIGREGDARNVSYAEDEDANSPTFGKLFLYKEPKGRTVGKNNCFTHVELKAKMLKEAGLADTFNVKGGNQVHFTVGTEEGEVVNLDGTLYFPLTFLRTVMGEEGSVVEAEETAPVEETSNEVDLSNEDFDSTFNV